MMNGENTITRCLHSERHMVVSNSIKNIEDNAFWGNIDIEWLTLPEQMDLLGNGAFRNCERLQRIDLPKEVRFVGKGLFRECHVLTKVVLPIGTEFVDRDMFVNCRELRELTVPESVASMDPNVFVWCHKLKVLRMAPWQMEYLVESHRRTALMTYMTEQDGDDEADRLIKEQIEKLLQMTIESNNIAALKYMMQRELLDRAMSNRYLEYASMAHRTEVAAMLLEHMYRRPSGDIIDSDPFA